MSSAAAPLLPIRFSCPKFSLFALALVTLLPATARAQTTYSGGGASFTTSSPAAGVTSTISVNGAPGTVKTVEVQLLGVKSTSAEYETGPYANEASYDSLGYAEFLLVGPGGEQLVLLYQTGSGIDGCDKNDNPVPACDGLQGSTSGSNPDTINIQDGAHSAPNGAGSLGQQYEGWQTLDMPYTVEPSSYSNYDGDFPPPLPTAENTADYPQGDGSAMLNGRFAGTTADGTWTLYLIDNDPYPGVDPFSITGWNLILTFAEAIPTTTTLSSSANPASYANSASSGSVTFTATVTSGSGTPTGTVTFQANGSTIPACNGIALSGGVAHCTVSLAQGANSIATSYTPSGSYGQSSTSMTQLMEVTAANTSGYTWCNSSLIADPENGNPGLAYPSVIKIPANTYSHTVGNVSVELEGLQGTVNGVSGQFLLVAPGGGTQNLDFFDSGFAQNGPTSPANLTFEDSASGYVPYGTGTPGGGPYLATDDNNGVNPDYFPASTAPSTDSNIPQVPSKVNFALPYGEDNTDYKPYTNIYTFGEAFDGASANGDWALYSTVGEGANVNSGWCITFTLNSGNATTTTLTSGSNPATTGQSLTFTATVTSGGNPVTAGGTVTFLDNNAAPAGTVSGNNVQTLNGSGQATFTTSKLTEGDHTITANYSGVANQDNESFSAVLNQRINTATTVTNVNSNTWQYCDPGAVQGISANPAGPLTPNPSVITVSNLPGAFNTVAVQLTNFSVPGAENLEQLQSLVEGPSGAALDFFSNTTQGSNGNSTASVGNYIFEDSATAQVSSGNVNLSPNSYKPTAYEYFLDAADRFTSSTSGFYPAPTAFSYAAPTSFGSDSTFADVFTSGSNANGTWALFFNTGQSSPQSTIGAANGWCVDLTETPPVLAQPSLAHVGNFSQGENNAQYTVNITNDGPGSTGDPTQTAANAMVVTDTLPTGLTYSFFSGTNWGCSASGQTVTCTNDSAIGSGDGYPALTIDVDVSASATGSVSNEIIAGGAGTANKTSNSDSAQIYVAPSINSGSSTTFTVGSPDTFSVTTAAATYPTASFSESGVLPSGVTLTDNGNGTATLAGTPAAGTSGAYPITITAANGTVNATQNFTLTVNQASAITSAAATTFTVGSTGSFSVISTGSPKASLVESGTLPGGVSFIDNGNGTATLSGTPAAGTGGPYPITITASNGVGSNATQNFTLTVDQAPAFNLGATGSDTMAVGTPNIVLIFTTGNPPPAIVESGALPSGVTFVNSGTGHGTLSGEPGAATGGLYNLVFTASNGTSPNATLNYALTIRQPIAFTSSAGTTFTTGTAGSFSVTTTGYPAPSFSETGALPGGVTFIDNGNGTATLAGTPAAGTGASYSITIKATNGSSTPSQTFTLTVGQAPAITSVNSTAFVAGAAGTFSVTTTGYPTSALSESGPLPSGLTFTDNGNGTGTLAGATASTGSFPITITANNGISPSAVQSFALTVNLPQYQLTTTANPAAGGTITPASGSIFSQGTSVPLQATPSTGYTFLNWASSPDSVASSTSASTTITMNSAETVTANFTPTLVVNTNQDPDTGNQANCSPQATAGTNAVDTACSLRDALTYAAFAGSGSISFDSTAFGSTNTAAAKTITLAYGTLNIPSETSITGPTTGLGATLANLVTVNGAGASSVFTVAVGVTGSGVSGLTITGGSSSAGGGISNGGALTVSGSTISGNTATALGIGGNGEGGGIFNQGTLTLSGSTVSGNTATAIGGGMAGGGGI